MTQKSIMMKTVIAAGLALGLTALATAPASAQGRAFAFSYPEQTGEEIYKGVCQGCHMPDAKGAVGAGMYPALAGDKKLASKAYPALVIINGQKAMPAFGDSFSDQQIANVINYVRSNYGNSYTDAITPEEVKKLRPVSAAGGAVRPPG
jgi:mono/diheme cytochrome c family protein